MPAHWIPLVPKGNGDALHFIVTLKQHLPGDMGCFAHITDTEGNRVGLHALS